MKRAIWLTSIGAPLLALLISQGCGFSGSGPNQVAPPLPADAPHPVTDLSQLAPGSALNPFGKANQVAASQVVSSANVNANNVQDVGGLEGVRHAGDDKHPAEERLLNQKAAQYPLLSARILDQVFTEMSHLQDSDEFSHLKLPTDLKWVIITATLDSRGLLKEIVIDQHSGAAAVDKMVVAACKKGLYIPNPPPEAADSDGGYKVRLEARFEDFASMDGEHWEFKSYLNLAML
jgi:hypothetical protein